MGHHTYRLFAVPKGIYGAARILDFAGNLDVYNVSDSPEQADHDALRSDWNAIGLDLHEAFADEASA